MEETNPELDSFRQQWRAEVSGRTKGRGNEGALGSAGPSKAIRRPPAAPRIAADPASRFAEEEDHVEPQTFSGLDTPTGGVEGQEWSTTPNTEPRSALEHYEKAVERESQGNLGDSLDLYRKAFKVTAEQL
jgi:F-box protein 9